MMGRSKVVAILAIVGGAAALAGVALPLTNQPKFCATCHTIRPSYESWTVSTHKEVTCVDCHVRPGVEGWLHDKAWIGTRDVLITFFGTPTEAHNLTSTVASEVCLSCHRAVLKVSEVAVRDLPLPVKEVGLIMSHRVHMEAFVKRGKGEGCTTCHSRIVHEKPIKNYPIVIPRGHVSTDSEPWHPDYPEGSVLRTKTLADCFRCHDGKSEHEGKVLSRKCETCHIPDKVRDLLF